MSIRLRLVSVGPERAWVALCAARSVEQPGDVYLDDAHHYALAQKFWRDYPGHVSCEPAIVEAVEREESNNANRDEWDRIYGECVRIFDDLDREQLERHQGEYGGLLIP